MEMLLILSILSLLFIHLLARLDFLFYFLLLFFFCLFTTLGNNVLLDYRYFIE